MATKTLGLTGRDYSTLAAWATYVNALSLAANEILEVYNDSGAVADTARVNVGGWTANGFSVTMRPASGQGIKDNANKLTNALRWNASNGAALTNNIGYDSPYSFNGANLVIEDLQIRATSSAQSGLIVIGCTVTRSILWANSGTSINNANGCTLRDCLIASGNGKGVEINGDNVDIDGCTIATVSAGHNGIRQIYTQSVPPRVRNTVFWNFTTPTQGSFRTGSTNNASSGALGGTGISGTTSIASTEFENVTASSEDFRVAAGASVLPGGGAASIGSGFDVVNTARSGSTPSIGAWEAASASGTPTGLATETDTALTLTSAAGFDFHTGTGLIFGDLAGALTSLAREASVGMVLRVYAVASPGSLVHESGTLTTGSNGRLPRFTHSSLSLGTNYHCMLIRASDGEIVSAKLTAT